MATKECNVYTDIASEFRRHHDERGTPWLVLVARSVDGRFSVEAVASEVRAICPPIRTFRELVAFVEGLIRHGQKVGPKKRPAVLVVLDVPLLHS